MIHKGSILKPFDDYKHLGLSFIVINLRCSNGNLKRGPIGNKQIEMLPCGRVVLRSQPIKGFLDPKIGSGVSLRAGVSELLMVFLSSLLSADQCL